MLEKATWGMVAAKQNHRGDSSNKNRQKQEAVSSITQNTPDSRDSRL